MCEKKDKVFQKSWKTKLGKKNVKATSRALTKTNPFTFAVHLDGNVPNLHPPSSGPG